MPLSFDDNKVLKFQLDMLIFVQSVQDDRLKPYNVLIKVLVLKEQIKEQRFSREALLQVRI